MPETNDERRLLEAEERYVAALHAMQSGVRQDHADGSTDGSPKHLRVGVNSAMVSDKAIVDLLIEKGVFSLVEFTEKLADAMEKEKAAYEAKLSERHGVSIHLA